MNKVLILVLLIVAGFLSFVLTFKLLNNLNYKENSSFLSDWQKSKQINKEQQDKEYQQLINRQGEQNTATRSPSIPSQIEKKALGKQILNIVYVKPSGLPSSDISLLIERLNRNDTQVFNDCYNGKCLENASLNFVTTYLSDEARKYNINNFELDIKTYGPFTMSSLQKVGDVNYYWGKDPFGIAKLKDSFEDTLKQNGLSFSSSDMVLFLYFDNSLDDSEANKKVGFYETKKFRSFADYEKDRIYANVYNFSPLFAEIIDKIVIHEALHLFGASDKYIEEVVDERLCKEEGRGDIYKLPTFPQNSGDIMCLFVEYADGKFKQGEIYDGTLVINSVTAREIGWIN